MKQRIKISQKEYCYHVDVIGYALYAERGKAVMMKKTSEISKMVGVSKRTLQFYDDEGVIKAKRSENNYRLYDRDALENLWEIMIYKEMGLQLQEIRQLLLMPDTGKKEYLKIKIKETEDRIGDLEEQKKFISLILTQGIPQMPDENTGVTYVERIAAMKKELHE